MRFGPTSLIRSRTLSVVSAAIRPKFFFVLSATIVTAALGATPRQQPQGASATVLLETRCAQAAADDAYFIPENLSEHRVPSGSGGYGYVRAVRSGWSTSQ